MNEAVRIQVSEDERAAGVLGPEKFEQAREAILDDGIVILDDLVPVDFVDSLRERMAAEVPALLERAKAHTGNRFPGQLNQEPPHDPEFLRPEILANPIALGIIRALVGDTITTLIYSSNVNIPGSTRQEVHCDLWQLCPDLDPVPRAPFSVVFNLPLVDTSDRNATELWLGTHLDNRTHTRGGGIHRDIPHAWLEERRLIRRPVQVAQRKGSVSLRDARLWHTGVANTGDHIRTMLAVGYGAGWYNGFAAPVHEHVAAELTKLGVPPKVDGWATMLSQFNASRQSA
jgi:ectoine hydroxylase-related dioxygenase (phytanoyl-CoA dioxygenase family)